LNFEKYQINKNTPIPLYYQFKQIILKEINNNSAKPDDPIPPEEVFCHLFDISRSTVRQAILELVNEGYLYRIKSKGTFISRPKISSDLVDMYGGYNIEIEGLNMTPYMKVIKREVINANNKISRNLHLEKNTRVLRIVRYRYADTQVMGYLESYLKHPLCDFVTKEKLEALSMYEILALNESTKIRRIQRTVETCYANEDEIELMEMDKRGLINLCINLGFSASDEPIIYEFVKYRGDKIKYSIEIDMS